jgi:GNAT superfamily N-acetyltransferase
MKGRSEIVDFETILPIWEEKLWPNRESEIKSMSSMMYQGGYDMSIYEKYEPTFFAVYNVVNEIVGVNSGHRTSNDLYRSRGIWVDPRYRLKGVSGILFCELHGQAMREGCTAIWSIPRQIALPAYEKYGFKQTSDFFDEGMEFGPNCYVYKELNYDERCWGV